jgi:hypothetical protein
MNAATMTTTAIINTSNEPMRPIAGIFSLSIKLLPTSIVGRADYTISFAPDAVHQDRRPRYTENRGKLESKLSSLLSLTQSIYRVEESKLDSLLYISQGAAPMKDTEGLFQELAEQWRRGTGRLSLAIKKQGEAYGAVAQVMKRSRKAQIGASND